MANDPIVGANLELDLSAMVEQLCLANGLVRQHDERGFTEPLPSRTAIIGMMESLRALLFPGYFGTSEMRPRALRYHLGHILDDVQHKLQEQIRRSLAFAAQGKHEVEAEPRARMLATRLLQRLPQIQRMLAGDVQAAYEGDPAAKSPDEAIFCYPGMLAIGNYRIAHELCTLGVPLLPRVISEYAHSITGIDIHPGATIGKQFFIDHGTGVVIGETCIIGDRVRIYQGVTLGAKSFPLDEQGNPVKGIPRHPLIEDDVVIYSGATILGRVTIGRGAVIGGNVWITRSVPPGAQVTLQPPRRELFDAGAGI